MISDKRIREIDMLRGFAAICMVLGHSFIKYPVNISIVPLCSFLQHFIYNFHMELFFVLAGMVYFCSHYGTFILKKCKRLIIPYVFFSIINAVFHAFGGITVSNSVPIKDGLIKIVMQGGGYWFLYSLFTVFLIYPFIEKIFNKPWKEIVLAVLIAVFQQFVELPDLFMIDTTAYYLPYFIMGHAVSNSVKSGNIFKNAKLNVLVFVISVVGYILIDIYGNAHDINFSIFDYIRAICIISALAVASHYFLYLSDKCILFSYIERFVKICSNYTLQIYVFNAYIMGVIRLVLCNLLNISSPLAIVLCLLFGNLAISITVCKWVIPRIPIVRDLCGLSIKKPVKT